MSGKVGIKTHAPDHVGDGELQRKNQNQQLSRRNYDSKLKESRRRGAVSYRWILEEFISLKSEPAQKAYRNSLKKLAEFLGEADLNRKFLEKIRRMTHSDAVRFSTWLRNYPAPDGQRIADATFSQRLHLLRRIFRYLVATEVVERNVFDAVLAEIPKRQRRQKRPTRLIPADKVVEILNMPDRRTKAGRRDFCMLSILFGGGLRISEACALNCGDIGVTTNGTLYLLLSKTKNGETQRQSLPEWAWEGFTELVAQRSGEGATNDDPLFVFYSVDGGQRDRLAVETLRRMFKRYTTAAGLGSVPPHSARATAATLLKSNGFQDRDVAAFLRHTSTSMVETYDKRIRTPETNCGLTIEYTATTKTNDKNTARRLSCKKVRKEER
jgi:integrase